MTADLRAALVHHKGALLARLRDDRGSGAGPLDPGTVATVLGPRPADAAVAALTAEVRGAIGRFQADAETGARSAGVLMVRGRPLAEYIDLGTLARLLAATPEARRFRAALTPDPPRRPAGSPWPAARPDLGPRTVIPYRACQDCLDQGGRPVRESVRLSFTDEIVSWTVSRGEGTFVAYGGRALCWPMRARDSTPRGCGGARASGPTATGPPMADARRSAPTPPRRCRASASTGWPPISARRPSCPPRSPGPC